MGQSLVSHTLLKSLHSENTLKTQTRSPFLEHMLCVLQACYTLYIETHGLTSPSKWSCLVWITCCVYRKGIRMIETFYTSRKGGEHLNAVYLIQKAKALSAYLPQMPSERAAQWGHSLLGTCLSSCLCPVDTNMGLGFSDGGRRTRRLKSESSNLNTERNRPSAGSTGLLCKEPDNENFQSQGSYSLVITVQRWRQHVRASPGKMTLMRVVGSQSNHIHGCWISYSSQVLQRRFFFGVLVCLLPDCSKM